MVSKLVLLSRYVFVTTEEQAKEFLELSRNPGVLRGLLVVMDGSLLLSSGHAYGLMDTLAYLMACSEELNLGILIVKSRNVSLDKRIERQLTHSSRIVSERN